MKKYILYAMYIIGIASLALMGFQCSSKEMTSAKLYIQRKEYDNASKQLEAETAKNPKNEEAWFLLGQIRFELKNYKGMKDAYNAALALAPTHKKEVEVNTVNVWGRIFNQGVEDINKATDNDGIDKAIETFQLAAYVLPESTANAQNIGYAYYKKGENDKAIPYLSESFEKGKSLFACKLISNIYLVRANDLKNKFTEQNKEELDNVKNLSMIHDKMKAVDLSLYIGQASSKNPIGPTKGKKPSGKEEWKYDKFNLVITVEDDIITAIKYTTPYVPNIDSMSLKQAYVQYNNAIDISKKAIVMFPGEQEISDNLMNAFIGAEKNEEARELLNDRVVKYPESNIDHYNLGVFLLKDNRYDEAIKQFTDVLNRDPQYSAAVYNLAAAYVNWGVATQDRLKKAGKDDDKSFQEKFKAAIPYLLQVLTEKPNDVQIWELLGQVYANIGEADKALEAYNKADSIRQGKN